MNPYYLSIVGLILDMFGAYFLAIEAIGIERLRTLRETRFRRTKKPANSDVMLPDPQAEQTSEDEVKTDSNGDPGCIIATGVLGVMTLAIVIFALSAFGINIVEIIWDFVSTIYLLTALIILFLSITFILIFSVFLGMIVYKIFALMLHAPISFIDYTERRYVAGTSGLLGFLFLTIGLLLQLLSNFLQQDGGFGN